MTFLDTMIYRFKLILCVSVLQQTSTSLSNLRNNNLSLPNQIHEVEHQQVQAVLETLGNKKA